MFDVVQHPHDPDNYRTAADFNVVRKLMSNGLYNVPQRLRQKVIEGAAEVLENKNKNISVKDRIAAAKLVLEMDKRNLEAAKIAIPQRHIHLNVKERTNEELAEIITKGMQVLPPKQRAILSRVVGGVSDCGAVGDQKEESD